MELVYHVTFSHVLYTAFTLLLLSVLLTRLRDYLRYTYPPGPSAIPIIGNIFNMKMTSLHLTVFDDRDCYGDVSHCVIMGTHMIILNTVDSIKEAMSGEYKTVFSGRPKSFFADYVIPDDLTLASYDERWVKLRHVAQTCIKPYASELKSLERVIIDEINVLVDDLTKMADQPFDIHTNLLKSTGNILYILIMGRRFEYNHVIHEHQHTAYVKATELLNPSVNLLLMICPMLRHFNIGVGRIYHDTVESLDDILKYLYSDIKSKRQAILYDLIDKQSENAWLSDKVIHDLIVDFLQAGIYTTTTTLYSLLLILVHRQDVQRRLQEEIDDNIGPNKEPCLDDQSAMPYTQAVILETLRYTSILPFALGHESLGDVTFRGYHLKKGTVVISNIWRVHHDEGLWDDPWTFEPQRFLGDDGTLIAPEHPNRRNLLAFGLGKRRCLGDVFARSRIFLFVTHLCKAFTFYNDDMDNITSMDPREFLSDFLIYPKSYKLQIAAR